MKTPLTEESQKNTHWIVIIIGSTTSILFGLLSLLQIGLKQSVGNYPAPNWLNNKKILIGIQKLADFKMVLEKNFKTIM